MSMFETACRSKIRFETTKGSLSVEDLWDLPLTSQTGKVNLDDIARGLHKQLNNGDNVSFVEPERKSDDVVQLKFDIAKHIIGIKILERTAASAARDRAEKKQKLLAIIADKQDTSLKNMSMDELQKALAEL